ncbi:MAG: hypothetical protein H6Q16_1803 [Bacteroidetes bacterium]|nr:hypothetical protein [Bacteroidota bacterium]
MKNISVKILFLTDIFLFLIDIFPNKSSINSTILDSLEFYPNLIVSYHIFPIKSQNKYFLLNIYENYLRIIKNIYVNLPN